MDAGWYPDPDPRVRGVQERWWDGYRWVDEVRPVAGTSRVSTDRAWMILVVLGVLAVIGYIAVTW